MNTTNTTKPLTYFSKPEHVFCWHYHRLSEEKQKLYRKLAEGIFAFRPTITFWLTAPDTIDEIYQKMKLDLPASFFDTGLEMVWNPLLQFVRVRPQYRFPREDAENILAAIQTRMEPLLNQCRGRTDLEKETIIHDWFMENVAYDHQYAQKMGGSSFEMAAPLLWDRGVCSGISKAAKFLFDQVGIQSLLLLGRTSSTAGNPGEDHCWLMVKINQPGQAAPQKYHLDLTFDMTTRSKRYFNLSDQEILADRILI